ncbi:xylose isomerase [Reticulibacter mediterranei]|uniref:Xylose isomerase n=1 Tax=Reticulibacter mediterranei TaxID=2778369 RepID=A0A8J3IN06_9CHLR|nr:sugar phosphate isomerase/epimerase family protein [Reticulibacter mediterranei]GHO97068.1 xylose isomerase [Reticulibacter mediterranei]
MPTPFTDLSRLSLNQATTQHWSVRQAVEGCVRVGVPAIGFWRHKVAETGLQESARIVREAGLQVSSLCRGGWFDALTAEGRRKQLDDNRRAIEEAATLGTDVLVLVCGPAANRDLPSARAYVEEAIATLLPYAAENGVRLGIEPLHPMYTGDRSVIVTLEQANSIVQRLTHEYVGVVIDVYHVWWEPDIEAQIRAAAGRILGFHICDWLVPTPDMLNGRGMMGDGVIDIRRLRGLVEEAGYNGLIEVEIFNNALWEMPGDEVLQLMASRYLAHA